MTNYASSQLAEWTGGRWTTAPVLPLTGFTIDSRQLRSGQVFVALRTSNRDGHDFLVATEKSGASAAIVAQVNETLKLPQLVVSDPLQALQEIAKQHRRLFAGPVIGISGSVGKTSTKNLLALLLGGESGGVLATEGNLNNHLGVPLTLTRLEHGVHKFAVVEAGISGPGEMAPLAEMISPDVAITTLVAPAHVAELGSIEGVAKEKAVLPAALRNAGVSIFPWQCAGFPAFAALAGKRIIVERADVVRPEEPSSDRVYFSITHRKDETAIVLAYGAPPPLVFSLRRVSDGMGQNAVLAICAALWLGVNHQDIQTRLGNWTATKMRGEFKNEHGKLLYVDCYNASPASMADALDIFYATAPMDQPRMLILGGMEELGAESEMFHRALGRSLRLRPEDQLFVLGNFAPAVCDGAIAGGAQSSQLHAVDNLTAIQDVFTDFKGAVFLKGSRRYQLETLLAESKEAPAHA